MGELAGKVKVTANKVYIVSACDSDCVTYKRQGLEDLCRVGETGTWVPDAIELLAILSSDGDGVIVQANGISSGLMGEFELVGICG